MDVLVLQVCCFERWLSECSYDGRVVHRKSAHSSRIKEPQRFCGKPHFDPVPL